LRLDYWRLAGLTPLSPHPGSPFTPFGLPEEIELRMFHGNNYPWIYSRLEHTTQARSNSAYGFLRGSPDRAESSEYRHQLASRDLLGDPRHRMTVYNGARNDHMPPWLWPSMDLSLHLPPNINNNSQMYDTGDIQQFMALNLKCDLRRPEDDRDVDGDGVADELVVTFPPSPYDDDINNDGGMAGGGIDVRDHHALIRSRLERALVDVQDGVSYFGTQDVEIEKTRRMAASMTANIVAYRDADEKPLTLDRAIEWRDPLTAESYRFVGLEAQPFLVEAFLAHVYKWGAVAGAWHPGQGDTDEVNIGDYIICDDSPKSTIVVVQIANPFDRPVDLAGFALSVFGQDLDFELTGLTLPLEPGQARTFYSMEDSAAEPVAFDEWKGLLGIIDGPDMVNVTSLNVWSNERSPVYDNADPDHAVELYRRINDRAGTPVPVLVDRLDIKPGLPDEPSTINKLGESFLGMPEYNGSCTEVTDPVMPWFDVKNIRGHENYAQMVHASRAWVMDVNLPVGIHADELNPRFVFANRRVDPTVRQFTSDDPDPANWFGVARLAHFDVSAKPDLGTADDRLDFPMQMLQKDADFQQLGELLNVWLFGHELQYDLPGPGGSYQETTTTFSEFLWDEIENQGIGFSDRTGVNRLRLRPTNAGGTTISPIIGAADNPTTLDPFDPMHRVPGLPAGARVLDAFVCDRGGVNPGDVDGDGISNTFNDEYLARLGLANGFSGKATPAMANLNTAAPETLRPLPHWARVVHETGLNETAVLPIPAPTPRARLAEAAVQYRERFGSAAATSPEPDYRDRQGLLDDGLRSGRGFASIGELMLLTGEPQAGTAEYKKSWRIDMAGQNPFGFDPAALRAMESTRISTDVVGGSDFDPLNPTFGPDKVAGDVEE
ncbi:MAG: hypothetical protein ACYSU7_18965, partial [Planctomycetota bacterium]